jgi:hypothetical protein
MTKPSIHRVTARAFISWCLSMQNVLRSFVIPVTPIIFGPASEFGSTWLRHHWNMICTDLHQSCDDFVGTKRLRFLASPWSFATPSITLMAASSCRMLTSLKNWPYQRQPMIDICGWSWLYYLIQKKWMANFPPHLVSDLDRLMNFVDLNTGDRTSLNNFCPCPFSLI